MATLQEIERALRAADAAGNVDDARALARAYSQMAGGRQAQPSQPSQPAQPITSVEAVLSAPEAPHRGYRAQVEAAMSGQEVQPKPQPRPWGDIGKSWSDAAGGAITGAATGSPAMVAGAPGDIEAVARALIPNVSRETYMPTSTGLINAVAGDPENADVAFGRTLGTFASPYIWAKGLKVAGNVAGSAIQQILGLRTGAGGKAMEEAYTAGKQGGAAGETFRANMRGMAEPSDVVALAKASVDELKNARREAYLAEMAKLGKQPGILDLGPVDDAIADAAKVGSYKGQIISDAANKTRQAISEVVNEWKGLDPSEFHTAEGLDALKRRIGSMAYDESLKSIAGPGTPGKIIVDKVYNAVKSTIEAQDPTYAKTMKAYADASDEIGNMESILSLNKRANIDTSLRKLQSILRNNANTNYGARVALGERLSDVSAGQLMPALAGQMLQSHMPRGLQAMEASAEIPLLALLQPQALPLVATSSPRIMGELTHGAGRLAGALQQAPIGFGGATGIQGNTALLGLTGPQLIARLLAQQSQAPVAQ